MVCFGIFFGALIGLAIPSVYFSNDNIYKGQDCPPILFIDKDKTTIESSNTLQNIILGANLPLESYTQIMTTWRYLWAIPSLIAMI